MEHILQSKEIDDRFALVVTWNKSSESPCRVHVVYDDGEFYWSSLEVSVADILALVQQSLQDVEKLLLEEVGSLSGQFALLFGSVGNSSSQSSVSPEAMPANQ